MLRFIVLISVLSILFVMSCTTPSAPSQQRVSPDSGLTTETKTTVQSNQTWEEEWERTLREAKKEGTVVIYTGGAVSPAIKQALPIIKKKYGIDVETVAGRGSQHAAKIKQERAAGLYLPDISIAGPNTQFSNPEDWTDHMDTELILPEVKNPDFWFDGKLPWLDKGRNKLFAFMYYRTPALTINTNLVGPKDITSFYDLLDPKWKGKILIGDASVAGTSFSSFASLLTYKLLYLDYFRKLVRQGLVMRDQLLVADWIARGKYPVTIFGTTTSSITRYVESGAPIGELDLKEGQFLSVDGSGLQVMNRRPHPNATKVFVNWLLSKEGQIHMQKEMSYQSARIDIGTETVDSIYIRQPGQKYYVQVNLSQDWVLNEQDKYMDIAKEIFQEGK